MKHDGVLDAVVIGAGFAGMHMLHNLRKLNMKAIVLDAASDVGGTWYWNRYPGARCDIESMEYSYSFDDALQQEWQWTERYAPQAEILKYAQYVATRLDLRKDIRFNSRVVSAKRDDSRNSWCIETEDGSSYEATFCVMAVGCLSLPNIPEFPGASTFHGKVFHTGLWPKEEIDFGGMRVGVIGTGSSGIQLIPKVAEQAEHLYVFQRTPNYSLPAFNRRLDPDAVSHYKSRYSAYRELARYVPTGVAALPIPVKSALEVDDVEREETFRHAWNSGSTAMTRTFIDVTRDERANQTASEFVRSKIRSVVKNPAVAELLTPNYPIGSKRLCLDSGFFETFNRENVTLVDVKSREIKEITHRGLRVGDEEFELDAIVFATGYDAITGSLNGIEIANGARALLSDKWLDGPLTYLGLMSSGYPNMFTITGPGSPSVLTNVIVSIEHHVEWISECLRYMRANGFDRVDATPEAERMWRNEVESVAEDTLLVKGNSWYLGANVAGKPRVFLPYAGGLGRYRRYCDKVVSDGYTGFVFDRT